MASLVFTVQPELARAARFPALSRPGTQITAAEIAVLLAAGVTAAAMSSMLHLSLRTPGHSILKVVLPVMGGLALVPRRGSGSVMSAAGFVTAVAGNLAAPGFLAPGAMMSLVALGPLVDLATARRARGWNLYAGVVAAAVFANLIAFGSRLVTALAGIDGGRGQMVDIWPAALASYLFCGAVAGVICVALLFRAPGAPDSSPEAGEQAA